ncbi:hypothetical protein XENORESO_000064 [Xenotaenia resolanae]|uniref:Uncharacterized protein n=1 Tax=Xenotaenia resolanae TaxID=208358 RepID=A0ABV0WQ66_9TELE
MLTCLNHKQKVGKRESERMLRKKKKEENKLWGICKLSQNVTRVCERVCVSERSSVHACVLLFCRFTPQELLSFLHRSLIKGRRNRGREEEEKWGEDGRDGGRL